MSQDFYEIRIESQLGVEFTRDSCWAAEGLFFEAETDGEDVLEDVERIGAEHHGLLKVDWDAMSDWATEGAES